MTVQEKLGINVFKNTMALDGQDITEEVLKKISVSRHRMKGYSLLKLKSPYLGRWLGQGIFIFKAKSMV
ncbi:MAG: hypothetical protein ABFC57_01080 [Veillonellales bacterium]